MSTEESSQLRAKNEANQQVSEANMTRQGSVVAAFTMASRISGLLRDIILSYLFGASQLADMFFVALRIPNFFRRLFAEGAFNQAFVPVLVRHARVSRHELLGFIAPLSGLFASILVLVVIAGVAFAPALTAVFAPGFLDDQEKFAATVQLVRITFPYLGFISLVAYAGAVLNAHNRFALPAFTPVLLNLSLIGAALVAMNAGISADSTEVVKTGGNSAVILAWGVLVAGAVQLLFQLPALIRLGLLPKPNLNHRHTGVRQVGKLLIPAVLAASVGQINALVNTILASTLITGSISWLYYADRLLELPIGLVAVALGTVMLPHLSRMAAADDQVQFQKTLDWGVNLGLLLGLPAAVALFLLAEPLIATLFRSFGSGAMTALDVRMAGYALEMFALALPGFVLVKILAPAFFAHEDTQSPMRYASGAVLANLVFSLATFAWFGHVGLAWATAISAWTHVVLLYWGLKRSGRYQVTRSLWPLLWKTLLASLLLGLGLVALNGFVDWMALMPITRLFYILGVSVLGMAGYLTVLWICGVRLKHMNHMSVV